MADNNHTSPLLENSEHETISMVSFVEPKMEDSDKVDMPHKHSHGKSEAFFKNILGALKSRRRALLKSLIHLPSIVITIVILSLTISGVFWEPPGPNTNVILNSLQFAAHLHGSFILMSLSAMLLSFIHYSLNGEQGIPLGFLGSGFQLNSLSYMFGKEFKHLNLRYIGIFFGAFGLAMLSNPSSAIVMLPRLQFWTIDNIWIGPGNVDFRVYIQANESNLYPTILTADNVPLECFQLNASLLAECPAYGMRRWLTMEEDLWDVNFSPINRTIEDGWTRYMVGSTSDSYVDKASYYATSTLSKFLGTALMCYSNLLRAPTIFWMFERTTIQNDGVPARYDLSLRSAGKEFPTRKPWVEVQCAGYPPNATTLSLPHDHFFIPSFPSFNNTEWNFPASDFSNLSVNLNSTIVNSSWVNIELFPSDQPRPSLGALFATPLVIFHEAYAFYTCAIDARWKQTSVILDGTSGQDIILDGGYAETIHSALSTIYISDLWSTAINPPWIDSISDLWSTAVDPPWMDAITKSIPSNRTILDTIGQMCFETQTFLVWLTNSSSPYRTTSDSEYMLACLQVTLSVYLADALSRAQDSIPTYLVSSGSPDNIFMVQDLYYDDGIVNMEVPTGFNMFPDKITTISMANLEDPSRFTEMYMKPSRYGYGYGFQDSKLVIFGVSILLLHVALCLVHIFWLLKVNKDNTTEWSSLGELLQAALGSIPINQEKDKNIWRERVVNNEGKIDKLDRSDRGKDRTV